MTNRTDLDKCCAQIELVTQLINQPETFDLNEVLIKLETKKILLMTYQPRDYITIQKGLESGTLKPIALLSKSPKTSEGVELVSAEEVEEIMRKKAEDKAKKEAELAEKKRIAEEEVKELHEAEARQKAAEITEKAIIEEKGEAEKLKAKKKAELLKEIEDLEA